MPLPYTVGTAHGIVPSRKIGNLLKHKMCLFGKAEGKKTRFKLAFSLRFQTI